MADPESPNSPNSINPPLPLPLPPSLRPILQNQQQQEEPEKPPRRVVFSDFPPREHVLERVPEEDNETHESESEHNDSDRNSDYFLDHNEQYRKRRYPACCPKCCAWTCLIVSLILLLLFFAGLLVASFIKSSLPQVYVTNLKFPKLEVVTSSRKRVLNAEVHALIQLSNKNDKTVLFYSPMVADVSSEDIKLGQNKISRFTQSPNNVTTLKVLIMVKKSEVYDVDATILKNNFKYFQIVLDVILSGKIGVDLGGMRIRLPIVIACEGVKQNDVNRGLKHRCNVQILPQR